MAMMKEKLEINRKHNRFLSLICEEEVVVVVVVV
jgi:hypothetical protein